MSGLRQVLLGFLAVVLSGVIIIGAFTLSMRESKKESAAASEQAQEMTPTVSQVKTQKPTASPTTNPVPSEVLPTSEESAAPTQELLPTQEPTEDIPEIQADVTSSEPETSGEGDYQSLLPGAFKEIPYQASIVIIQEEAPALPTVTEQEPTDIPEETPYQASVIIIQDEAEPTSAATEQPADVTVQSCKKPRSWVAYTIRRGDTLSRLSRMTGVSISKIKKVNCLESNKLKPGKTIYIPRAANVTYIWHPVPYPPMQPPLYYNPPRKPQSAEQIRPVVIVTMPP